MVNTLAALLLYQCIGEILVLMFRLPVPGPVIGMVLLLLSLSVSPRLNAAIEQPSLSLLQNLSLLFVPAGVGVMVYADRVFAELLPIAVAVVAGTALTIAATALVANFIRKAIESRHRSMPVCSARSDSDLGAGR